MLMNFRDCLRFIALMTLAIIAFAAAGYILAALVGCAAIDPPNDHACSVTKLPLAVRSASMSDQPNEDVRRAKALLHAPSCGCNRCWVLRKFLEARERLSEAEDLIEQFCLIDDNAMNAKQLQQGLDKISKEAHAWLEKQRADESV